MSKELLAPVERASQLMHLGVTEIVVRVSGLHDIQPGTHAHLVIPEANRAPAPLPGQTSIEMEITP